MSQQSFYEQVMRQQEYDDERSNDTDGGTETYLCEGMR
jgi:hypothetical protein